MIAVLGEENLWPSSQYNIGLFYLFLPTVVGIVTSITEYFAAPAVIEGEQFIGNEVVLPPVFLIQAATAWALDVEKPAIRQNWLLCKLS